MTRPGASGPQRGATRARTADPLRATQVRCQLRHSPFGFPGPAGALRRAEPRCRAREGVADGPCPGSHTSVPGGPLLDVHALWSCHVARTFTRRWCPAPECLRRDGGTRTPSSPGFGDRGSGQLSYIPLTCIEKPPAGSSPADGSWGGNLFRLLSRDLRGGAHGCARLRAGEIPLPVMLGF